MPRQSARDDARPTFESVHRYRKLPDLDALAADFWPEDESADDINDYIEAQRHSNPRL